MLKEMSCNGFVNILKDFVATMLAIFHLLLITCFVEQTFCAMTCKNVKNKKVDWFIIYKLPRIKTSSLESFKTGTGMMYLDGSQSEWKVLNEPITGQGQPVYYTMKQVYDSKVENKTKAMVYLMYNDKASHNKTSSSKAHAKGSLGFDKTSGFWLIHSVPGFPAPHKYSYPDSGTIFGQTFLCVTFKTDSLDMIGSQLKLMNPQIYGKLITPYFQNKAPIINSLLNGTKFKKPKIQQNKTELKSDAGKTFVSFSKSKYFGKDLYLDFVMPSLKSNLFVQTWLNGNGDYHSNCSLDHTVKNVWKLNIAGMTFKDSQDHSKWAISNPDDDPDGGDDNDSTKSPKANQSSKNWVCVGDINRQNSQASRGGGTLCFQNGTVWREFRKIVKSYEDCNGKEITL